MSLLERAKDILIGESMPPVVVRGIARAVVAIIGWRMRIEDRRQAAREPRAKRPGGLLYLVDGYHGGVIFWDWLGLVGGGLWRIYNWPLCVRPSIERALRDDRFRVVLDFDGYTYEWMMREDPRALEILRRAIERGRVELVNGTYAQPFGAAESGESFIRQLEHGRGATRAALGVDVETFYSQEPSYFPQMPQLLRGFGYERAVFRTQWAAFGTDPSHDADMISWVAPDGSRIATVPRYTFQHYERQRREHPGLAAGSLSMGDLPDWAPESLAPFEETAGRLGIAHPLVTDLKDTNIPDAPMPRAVETALMGNVRFTTLGQYARHASGDTRDVFYGLDDIPCTLPWGLQADEVGRAVAAAERALHTGERLDAAAWLSGDASREGRLSEAWKGLCLAQHHDLFVCGPWHSRAHNGPMSRVATEYAASARKSGEAVAGEALRRLADRGGGDVIVFNPAAHDRLDYVEASVPRAALPSPSHPTALFDGVREYACQVTAEEGDRVRLGALVRAPSLGIVHLAIVRAGDRRDKATGEGPGAPPRVEVSTDGCVTLLDGRGTGLAEGPFLTCTREGVPYDSRASVDGVRWIDDGPVFRRLEATGAIAGLRFIQTLTLYGAIGRIDVGVRVDFGDDGIYLGPQIPDDEPGRASSIQDERKLCLAFASSLPRMCCASPFWIGDCRGERAASASWVGLEGANGGGFALINRGTRGYHFDRASGIIRNVLAWGPREWIYASDDSITRGRSAYTALRGRQSFDCAVAPYVSRGNAERSAIELALPLRAMWCGAGRGSLDRPWSALSVAPGSVVVTALLVRGDALYARLWNASDRPAAARVKTAAHGRVFRVSLGLDGAGEELPDNQIRLAPWGVAAVRIDRGA